MSPPEVYAHENAYASMKRSMDGGRNLSALVEG
jgi:hypothetical protein